MPRRRNGRSSRDAVIYIHVLPADVIRQVIVEVLLMESSAMEGARNETPNIGSYPDGNNVEELLTPHCCHNSTPQGFDGIELHGDEFVFD